MGRTRACGWAGFWFRRVWYLGAKEHKDPWAVWFWGRMSEHQRTYIQSTQYKMLDSTQTPPQKIFICIYNLFNLSLLHPLPAILECICQCCYWFKLFFSLANCKNISVSPKLPVCSRLKTMIWCFPSILAMHPLTDLFPQSNTEMPLPGLLCIEPTRLSFSNRNALGVIHKLLKSKNNLSLL